MVLAIVICGVCKKWVKLGAERAEGNRYYCEDCYKKRPKGESFDAMTGEKIKKSRKKLKPQILEEELADPKDPE
jgi:hypothetical protein